MKDILRFVLVLFLVNLVAAFILAGVYFITKPKIDEQEALAREEALTQVMPASVGDRLEAVEENGEVKYWKAFKGSSNKIAGYVFVAKKYGYSSVIETMVGVKAGGTITGVKVLNQNETPGLGAKIVEIVSDRTLASAIKGIFLREKKIEKKIEPYFTEQFTGRNVKDVDISNIDAITGATISSKAVVDSIKEKGLEMSNVR
ncbi:MAG: RnfABCDGE type electron transport complex subunit G [Candidatus Omnitrophica bacterium]|nr:RnfABCDGE type electron transport complex subunit G [Candidatus Omnitrophota bacterium]